MRIFKKCIFKKTIIHSVEYTRTTKTDDTFILSIANEIINVHHLIVVREEYYIYECCVLIKPYSVGQIQMDHIYREMNECGNNVVITSIENFKK